MSHNFVGLINDRESKSEVDLVGHRLRALRKKRGLSLRALANWCGLNVNTLSMIENGKTSPTVSTLNQLAEGMNIPISEFFRSGIAEKQIVYTESRNRPLVALGNVIMESLGLDFCRGKVQPFIVTLEPGMGSGERDLIHAGLEFVYCLQGTLHYLVLGDEYSLKVGDSLVFEAHLPHRWDNSGEETAQVLTILYPTDERENIGVRHFSINYMKQEKTMKIAVITDDGKTISQHFGRAPYYAVLSVEDGKIITRELRSKMGHNQFRNETHNEENHTSHAEGHGRDPDLHSKHVSMVDTISDCKALICGGMGRGAYESLLRLNIQPVVTELKDVDFAVQLFIEGKLVDRKEMLH